jgi:hypothetical protein
MSDWASSRVSKRMRTRKLHERTFAMTKTSDSGSRAFCLTPHDPGDYQQAMAFAA